MSLTASEFGEGNRREFLRALSATGGFLVGSASTRANLCRLEQPIRLGIIADLHQDVMHDGQNRLEEFLAAMHAQRPDAIIQLGDFAVPAPQNRLLVDTFNGAHPQALHVLGNHDTDGGYKTERVLDFWGMKARYYSHDIGGVRLIVLDGNETPPNFRGRYPAYIGTDQLEWLRAELQSHEGPILVFSHQPLAGAWSIDNATQVQDALNETSDRVVLAINGHSHIDDMVRAGNVGFLHVNSASYVWVGREFKHETYPEEILNTHPRLAFACPYRDPLFTMLTLEPKTCTVAVQECQSEWIGKSPAELGRDKHPDLIDGEQIAPRIRSRRITRLASY